MAEVGVVGGGPGKGVGLAWGVAVLENMCAGRREATGGEEAGCCGAWPGSQPPCAGHHEGTEGTCCALTAGRRGTEITGWSLGDPGGAFSEETVKRQHAAMEARDLKRAGRGLWVHSGGAVVAGLHVDSEALPPTCRPLRGRGRRRHHSAPGDAVSTFHL